ncbi:hypothetical protein EST38_g5014 [Candolleomyces aberdarensis]|uniref:EamA domain-containing protein n=1 Tax=Candolleomyces aberdarensis TaxID=2316362 RepID=A0A4Q2DLK0_9AGAR|nr:hypothetical protein EST38_g5014 [Candolleomyces aberdarensis]
MIGVLGATLAYTSLRAIGRRAHAMHAMVAFSGISIVFSATAMLTAGTQFVVPDKLSWLAMLLMIGTFGFIAQYLLTLGLQYETAGRGTMAIYTQIVFATILQRIFLHATPPPLSILGTLIIVSSALYTALSKTKQVEEVQPGHSRGTGHSTLDEEQGLLNGQTTRDNS